ncbi:MAG: PEP-CTERM sorting domain-containing protein [Verrucomicrobiota bacterium]
MKRNIIPILGLTGLALGGLTAHADPVFNYTDGDLILDFSKSGSSDVIVDIGNLASLNTAAVTAGGTVALSGGSAPSPYFDITTQLLGTFGSVNGLSFTVFGLQNTASGGVAAKTVYLTQQQTGGSPNTPPNNVTASKQNGIVGVAQSVIGLGSGTGILPWSAANAADSVANTANVAIIPTSGAASANSYTTKGAGAWGSYAPTSPSIANTTPGTFSTDGGSITSDLFEYDYYSSGGPTHPTILQGEFSLDSTGVLSFTTIAPVPEPSTYGLITAGGVLVILLRNRNRRKSP